MQFFVSIVFLSVVISNSAFSQSMEELCIQNDKASNSKKVLKYTEQCKRIDADTRKYEFELLQYCSLPGSSISLSTKPNKASSCGESKNLELFYSQKGKNEVSCAKVTKENLELVAGDGSDRMHYVLRNYDKSISERSSYCTHKSKLNSNSDSYLISLAEFDSIGSVAKKEFYPRHCLVAETGSFWEKSKKMFCLILNGAKCHSSKNKLEHAEIVQNKSTSSKKRKEIKRVLQYYLQSTGRLAETATEILFKKNPELRPSLVKAFAPEGGVSYLNQVNFPESSDWEDLVNKPELVSFLSSYYKRCAKLFPNTALDSSHQASPEAQ